MARKGPLRKVVKNIDNPAGDRLTPWELLECGHSQPMVQDMIGPTNAYRRRCRGCHANALKAPAEPKEGGKP